jgi:hypothetical protein
MNSKLSARESLVACCSAQTVWCATKALADYPLLGFLRYFLGLLLNLSLGLLRIFISSFEVLHPQSLSPIIFASSEL